MNIAILALKFILWTIVISVAVILVLLIAIMLFKVRIEMCVGKKNGLYLRIFCFRFDILKIVNKFSKRKKENKSNVKDKTDGKGDFSSSSSNKENRKNNDEISDIEEIKEISEGSGLSEKTEKIKFYAEIIIEALKKFFGAVKIKILKLNISVAENDAAKTAETYGIIVSLLSGIFAFAENFKKIKVSGKNSINVSADFLGEKTQIDISTEISFYVWQALHIAANAFFKWFYGKNEF